MKAWLFRALRNQRRRSAARGGVFGPGRILPVRSLRLETLEDRQMLTATVTTIQSFENPSAYYTPTAGFTADGSVVFGTTYQGGSDNDGVLFEMNADGSNYQVLHTFTGSANDGANPVGTLLLVGSTLYGTTESGSEYGGTIFSINTDGSDFQILHVFGNSFPDGQQPEAGLTLSGNTLYGTTFSGDPGEGTVYSINTDGSDFQVIYAFSGPDSDGFWPAAPVTVVGSTVFGTTSLGGAYDDGTIFSVNTDGSNFKQLYSFDLPGGGNTDAGVRLTLVGSKLYGTTTTSAAGPGTIFSIDTDGTDYQTVFSFSNGYTDGYNPVDALTLVGSTLYGATQYGGSGLGGGGIIFSINPDGSNFQALSSFPQSSGGGQYPDSPLTLDGSTLLGLTYEGGSAGDGTIYSVSGATPNFAVTASNGSPLYELGEPAVAVDAGLAISSTDADLNGATAAISAGTLAAGDVLNFTNQNGITGSYSGGVLTLTGSATPAQYQAALQSVTFSTTSTSTTARSISIVAQESGESSNTAAEEMVIAVPQVYPSGTTNTFLIGGSPVPVDSGVLVSYSKPELTGFTATISAVTYQPGDTLNFTSQNGITGSYAGGVLTLSGSATAAQYEQALDSVTFSTTSAVTGTRSISLVALDGSLHSTAAAESVEVALPTPVLSVPFTNISGYTSNYSVGISQLIGANFTAVGSTLFGTAGLGYQGGPGVIFSMNPDGSDLTILHSFTGTDGDGENPMSSMTLVGSTLFGTTEHGGAYGDGTIFSINVDGTGYKVLYSFGASGTDGQDPIAGLTLAGSTLFGTTVNGGSANDGTVFSINTDGSGYQVVHSFTDNDDGNNPYNGDSISGLTLVGSTLYGTAASGGYGVGSIFSINTNGGDYQVLHEFAQEGIDGNDPDVGLTLDGSTLYGTTEGGGADGRGTIFSIDTDGSDYQTVYTFNGVYYPNGLTLVGSTLYGTTEQGGPDGIGTVFSVGVDGTGYQTLYSFNFNDYIGDEYPETGLTLLGSTLYGSTGTDFLSQGGMYSISDVTDYADGGPGAAFDAGLTVTLTPDSTDLTGATVTISPGTLGPGDLLNFTNQNGITGNYSGGVLTLSGDATAAQYQAALQSVTFSSTATGLGSRSISTVTFDAAGTQASNAVSEEVLLGAPVVKASGATNLFTIGGPAVAVDSGVTVSSPDTDLTGATVTISSNSLEPCDVLNFTNQNGISGGYAGGVLTLSGSATVAQYQAALQSVTFSTTTAGSRSISIVAVDGSLNSQPAAESVDVSVFGYPVISTDLHSFDSADLGSQTPTSGLTVDGSLVFGTTFQGGSDNDGVIYSMNADGSNYQIVHTFTGSQTDGANPVGTLVLVGSTLYGTTESGGGGPGNGGGTIFSINTDGSGFTVLQSFGDAYVDWAPEAGLTLSGTTLYGTTSGGGQWYSGTVFSINTDGSDFQVIHSFTPAEFGGFQPESPVTVVGSTLYGTTSYGGPDEEGTIYSVNLDGSDYQMVYSFTDYGSGSDGIGLTLVGSALYGAITDGGNHYAGSVYSINTDGTDFQTLHSFGAGSDGSSPVAGLTLVGSALYGTTEDGGSGGAGTIFSMNPDGSNYQTLYSFPTTGTGGQNPVSAVTLDGSALLGVALAGGSFADGTVYSVSGATPSFTVTASNTAPIYSPDGPAVAIDGGLTVSSADADLTGATVTISAGTLQPGDVLNFTNQNGISGSYAGGVLTLSGSATPAQYQAALESVTFSTTSTATTTRSISIVAQDGDESSNTAEEEMLIAAPMVLPSGTTNTFLISGAAVPVDSGVVISYTQPNLTGLTVTISAGTYEPGDTLNFTNPYGITSSYADGVLTLSGSASIAEYQAALQSVTFSTTSTVTGTRWISIVAADGSLDSNSAAESVGVAFPVPVLSVPEQNLTNVATEQFGGANLTAVGTTLFGTTNAGGGAGAEIFSMNANGSGVTVLHFFTGIGDDGTGLASGLTLVGSTLWGTTTAGGQYGDGTIFSINTDGSGYQVWYSFGASGTDGLDPAAGLTLDGSTLFGTTSGGGTADEGTLFSINTDGTGYQVLYSFTNTYYDSGNIVSSLTLSGSTLYGTTSAGGDDEEGTVFSIHTDGSDFQVLRTFDWPADGGGEPMGGLTLIGSTLYGTTEQGGDVDYDGTVFSINTDGSDYQVLHSFTGLDGVRPQGGLTLVGSTLYGTAKYGGEDGGGIVFSIDTDGTNFQVVHAINYADGDGQLPVTGLTLIGTTLYGSTTSGGDFGLGTIFTVSDVTNYDVGGPGAAFDAGMTISLNPDGTDLNSATVTISPGTLQPGDLLNFTNQNGITGSYASGVLTLSGNATAAQYQAALESVTFSTTGTGLANRSISTVTYDGGDTVASNAVTEEILFGAPLVTPSGVTNTFAIGGAAVAVDSAVTISSADTDLTGATVTISAGTLESGDMLNFVNQNGISGSYSDGVLTLTGSATVAQYEAALQSVTFSTNSLAITRSISIIAVDGSLISDPAAESVDVTVTAPVVTPSGATSTFTTGGSPVAIDAGILVSSVDADLTGATVTISAGTLQPGDNLSFDGQDGITYSYSNGVLTLSGIATPAQYQAALQSVTFSNWGSSSTTPRSISIVAIDGSVDSNTASETVDIQAPVTIVGAYVAGSAWSDTPGNDDFDGYLAAHGLGDAANPALGYALQTGTSQLTPLPWINIDTISVQFSGPVINIGLGSLELLGGTGTGAAAAPAVTGFTYDGNNTYSWTLSGPLGNNNWLFCIATTGSPFGTPGSTQVTDPNGVGISGAFTTGLSSFPSGNGLPGSMFDFFFNVLPGNGLQNGVNNSIDTAITRSKSNEHVTSAGYSPYFDYNGAGIINSVDAAVTGALANDRQTAITPPAVPSWPIWPFWPLGPVGFPVETTFGLVSTGITDVALGAQETASSTSLATGSSASLTASSSASLTAGSPTTSGSPTGSVSNFVSASSVVSASNVVAASAPAATTGTAGSEPGSTTPSTPSRRDHGRHHFGATDEAVSDFDLADLYV